MQRNVIELKVDEVDFLRAYLKDGLKSKREYDRANILLLLHKGKTHKEIADFLDVERTTVWRLRKRYLKEGLQKALEEKERSGQPKKYRAKHEAEIIALACSNPPEGRIKWTLELLKEKLKPKKGFTTINKESIRLTLKKTTVNLG